MLRTFAFGNISRSMPRVSSSKCAPPPLDAENLVVDDVDQIVVAGDGLQQRWRRREDRDVLGSQNVAGLPVRHPRCGPGMVGVDAPAGLRLDLPPCWHSR